MDAITTSAGVGLSGASSFGGLADVRYGEAIECTAITELRGQESGQPRSTWRLNLAHREFVEVSTFFDVTSAGDGSRDASHPPPSA
jgi:hypothetical protein